jgi:hypothetical protein
MKLAALIEKIWHNPCPKDLVITLQRFNKLSSEILDDLNHKALEQIATADKPKPNGVSK